MVWKITSESKLAGYADVKRYCRGICVYHPDRDAELLWWSYTLRKWTSVEDAGRCSSHAPCKTYRAFLRHLREHPELKGYEVTLVGQCVASCFVAVWKDE